MKTMRTKAEVSSKDYTAEQLQYNSKFDHHLGAMRLFALPIGMSMNKNP
jgi:hypothetical protein